MRLSRLLVALLCGFPLLAFGRQSPPPAQVQPQVWPPRTEAGKQVQPAMAQASPVAADTRGSSTGIRLDVVVTDKAGNLVTGLKRSDFKLLDDNHLEPIQSFHAYGGTASQPEMPTQIFL